MEPYPNKLELVSPELLRIEWSDGYVRRYAVADLRQLCPCATCQEKRAELLHEAPLPIVTLEETRPVRIAKMEPVGRYAYNIGFSDGHDTGIYTFGQLREMGDAE